MGTVTPPPVRRALVLHDHGDGVLGLLAGQPDELDHPGAVGVVAGLGGAGLAADLEAGDVSHPGEGAVVTTPYMASRMVAALAEMGVFQTSTGLSSTTAPLAVADLLHHVGAIIRPVVGDRPGDQGHLQRRGRGVALADRRLRQGRRLSAKSTGKRDSTAQAGRSAAPG